MNFTTSTVCQLSIISGNAERAVLNFGDKDDANIGRVTSKIIVIIIYLFLLTIQKYFVQHLPCMLESQPLIHLEDYLF